ncbi:Methyl-accepting chemotaxis protein [Microbacterium esteraromaticum]|uniref:Methyl-accepting chemotaxis protein n=1 Tax=Microbacterium esteraromaticum TaxID=57043 RepID=A0A1R4K912_9MICO|nr:DUF4012 domain-containing protein [Microbacterium esteraromaticum]SJN40776.1 Methyl-accepting chemotaxis protein [Microbacterium esteraromaticum]
MTTRAERRAERTRRPLLRSYRFWIPMGVVLLLLVIAIVGAIVGKHVYDRAMSAKGSLEKAVPLASQAADAVLDGDTEKAQQLSGQLAALTTDAREQTDDGVWKSVEWVPVAGPNLYAVRTAAAVTDDLVRDALTPATALSLDVLKPKDGAIDLAGITEMHTIVGQAQKSVDAAARDLATIDRDALISQVSGAIGKLTSAVDELQPMLGPASDILGVLPQALGADQPRHYLMMFQNNAESRGTGGNPAALVMIDVDKGRISIGQQASSSDFDNGRAEPITALNPETQALYGDKIGRWIMDSTLSPDFTETADIVRAWWAEQYGTPIDAVASFDPVALSYLLGATGPASVPNEQTEIKGRTINLLTEPLTLTAENATPFLLNEIYWKYPIPAQQDAVFAASARAVFDTVTSGKAEPKALLEALTRAVDEGRLMYQPANEDEAKLVGETELAGKLPSTNKNSTMLGAYVNDFTEGKLDYYMQLDLVAESTQCAAANDPSFSLSATLTNTLKPEQVADLPSYISPGRFFDKGRVATNLVLYGPVGATTAKVTVDGTELAAKTLPHLGRPAVLVPIYNNPGQKHTVTVEFAGDAGKYGPLDVRHTPMVRETHVEMDAAGCQ